MRKGARWIVMAGAAVGVLLVVRACSAPSTPAPNARDLPGKGRPSTEPTDEPTTAGGRPSGSASAAANKVRSADGGGAVVFFSPWGGSGLDQLGRDRPEEGNPLGPMSLSVDKRGRVYVLDEVNSRIVRRGADGKAETAIRIESKTPEDIAVAADGSIAVLDRHDGQAVTLFDESGAMKGTLPLVGEGIEDSGEVTGVFVDGNDIYAERAHGSLVKVGDTSGMPAEPRSEIPGRPTRDGLSYISAGITDPATGRVYVASVERATMEHRFTRELRLKTIVHSIVLLDSDVQGTIYFGVELESAAGDSSVLLSCLEPLKGITVGTAVLPANTLPEETFRDFVVLDGGGVVYAVRSEQGVSYMQYDCE